MKRVAVSEGNKQFDATCPDDWTLIKTQVDGGLIQDCSHERCDWLVEARSPTGPHSAMYVELKGNKLLKAISQLESTIKILDNHCAYNKKYAFVVCSKIPTRSNSAAQIKQKIFKDKYGFILRWFSRFYCHNLP